jgi:hypothetical protein
MNQTVLRALLAAALLVPALGAQAQPRRNYNVPVMNYDMWCQETMGYAFERCIKRQPADVEAFEAFRSNIQGYEIQHLQQKARDARIENNILHNDPVDQSQTGTLQAQQQNGLTPPLPRNVP